MPSQFVVSRPQAPRHRFVSHRVVVLSLLLSDLCFSDQQRAPAMHRCVSCGASSVLPATWLFCLLNDVWRPLSRSLSHTHTHTHSLSRSLSLSLPLSLSLSLAPPLSPPSLPFQRCSGLQPRRAGRRRLPSWCIVQVGADGWNMYLRQLKYCGTHPHTCRITYNATLRTSDVYYIYLWWTPRDDTDGCRGTHHSH